MSKTKKLVIESLDGRSATAKVAWGDEPVPLLREITFSTKGVTLRFMSARANVAVKGDAPASLPELDAHAARVDAEIMAALKASGKLADKPQGAEREAGLLAVTGKRDRIVREMRESGFVVDVEVG
jgi:hypothetical protein